MFKFLVLVVLVVIITVALMRLRARMPWNEVTKRANRRGLLAEPMDAATQDQVIDLLMQGKKFKSIRMVRAERGMTFRDAKLLVEAIEAGHRPARIVRGETADD